MIVGRFRSISVITEAVLFNGEFNRAKEIEDWTCGAARPFVEPGNRTVMNVSTNHGTVRAEPGDWVIKNPHEDEFYPCNPATFEAKYERVKP